MRNIEIDGNKLYGVTNVVKEIKFGEPSNKVVRIEKKDKGVYVSLVPKDSLDAGELSINTGVLLDYENYNDYDLMETKPEPTYNGVRRLLIEFIINWKYDRIGYESQRVLEFYGIMEQALIGTNLKNQSRLSGIRNVEARLAKQIRGYI